MKPIMSSLGSRAAQLGIGKPKIIASKAIKVTENNKCQGKRRLEKSRCCKDAEKASIILETWCPDSDECLETAK